HAHPTVAHHRRALACAGRQGNGGQQQAGECQRSTDPVHRPMIPAGRKPESTMHRSLSLLAVACALAACSSDAPAPAGSPEVPAATPVEPPRGSEDESAGTTRLTIYSGDYE